MKSRWEKVTERTNIVLGSYGKKPAINGELILDVIERLLECFETTNLEARYWERRDD